MILESLSIKINKAMSLEILDFKYKKRLNIYDCIDVIIKRVKLHVKNLMDYACICMYKNLLYS